MLSYVRAGEPINVPEIDRLGRNAIDVRTTLLLRGMILGKWTRPSHQKTGWVKLIIAFLARVAGIEPRRNAQPT